MDRQKLSPAQQVAWAKGKLVTSVFLNDIEGCKAAWQVLNANRDFVIHRQPDQAQRGNLAVH